MKKISKWTSAITLGAVAIALVCMGAVAEIVVITIMVAIAVIENTKDAILRSIRIPRAIWAGWRNVMNDYWRKAYRLVAGRNKKGNIGPMDPLGF